MDFECVELIIEVLCKKVEYKIFGYSLNDSDKYFNVVCDWYKRRFNWEINRKDIIFSFGVVFVVVILVRILINFNEGVIV